MIFKRNRNKRLRRNNERERFYKSLQGRKKSEELEEAQNRISTTFWETVEEILQEDKN